MQGTLLVATLVLQLRFVRPVVGLSGLELVALPPGRPRQDEWRAQRRSKQQFGDQAADFWHAGQSQPNRRHTSNAGLVLFGLPNAARRSEACNLARNAAAAMHNAI